MILHFCKTSQIGVDFVIAGLGRCGTTSLHQSLVSHPNIAFTSGGTSAEGGGPTTATGRRHPLEKRPPQEFCFLAGGIWGVPSWMYRKSNQLRSPRQLDGCFRSTLRNWSSRRLALLHSSRIIYCILDALLVCDKEPCLILKTASVLNVM